MGDYLSHPEVMKHCDDGESEGVSASLSLNRSLIIIR